MCSKTFTVWWDSICSQKSSLACWKNLLYIYIYMFAWETCVFMKQHVFKVWKDHLGERIVHQFNNSVQNLVVWWNSKRYQKSYIYVYIYTLILWLYEIEQFHIKTMAFYKDMVSYSNKRHGRHGFIQNQCIYIILIYIYRWLVNPKETHWNVLNRATHISWQWGVVFMVIYIYNPVGLQSRWQFWLIHNEIFLISSQ
jgi:hypothetical protein